MVHPAPSSYVGEGPADRDQDPGRSFVVRASIGHRCASIVGQAVSPVACVFPIPFHCMHVFHISN